MGSWYLRGFVYPLLLGFGILIATSCGGQESVQLPETTAASVMGYLAEVDYQDAWELWPGLGEKYPSEEPHGFLLTTYLNRAAVDALNRREGSMPPGAIIVKENYTAEGAFDATTVMYKSAGYNPDHNDWFWAKVAADGAVQAEGQVEGCQTCHGDRRDNDYVLSGALR